MNEELYVAVEELRRRTRGRRFFLPITLGPCEVPEHPIGPGETLRDIHHVDLSRDWWRGVAKLAEAIIGGGGDPGVRPVQPAGRSADVLISYASVDRLWAEWIDDELAQVGRRVSRHEVDLPDEQAALSERVDGAGRVLAVVWPAYAAAAGAARLWELAQEAGDGFLWSVRTDGPRLPTPYGRGQAVIDLVGLPEERARAALLAACDVDLPASPASLEQGDEKAPLRRSWWEHPYTLAGKINHANALSDLGDHAAARTIDSAVHEVLARRDALGPDHPHTLIALGNLGISSQATGQDTSARDLREDLLARFTGVFGADHPKTVSARNRERLSCEIEPPES